MHNHINTGFQTDIRRYDDFTATYDIYLPTYSQQTRTTHQQTQHRNLVYNELQDKKLDCIIIDLDFTIQEVRLQTQTQQRVYRM